MFGKNEIVGQRFFNEVTDDKLFVTSMFLTIQGEGPLMGRKALFIRVAKCNLNCNFCDTFFDAGTWMTFDEIDKKISEMTNERSNIALVMSGGEPMLQKNIGKFLETIGSTFKYTQIESNGTLLQQIPSSTILVVSPKCSQRADGSAIKYLNIKPEVLARINALKFVITADENSPYHTIPDWAKNSGKEIYISPMNMYSRMPEKAKTLLDYNNLDERSVKNEIVSFWEEGLLDKKANQANHEYAAQYCIKNNFILNLQMQLYCSLA